VPPTGLAGGRRSDCGATTAGPESTGGHRDDDDDNDDGLVTTTLPAHTSPLYTHTHTSLTAYIYIYCRTCVSVVAQPRRAHECVYIRTVLYNSVCARARVCILSPKRRRRRRRVRTARAIVVGGGGPRFYNDRKRCVYTYVMCACAQRSVCRATPPPPRRVTAAILTTFIEFDGT